MKKIALIMLMLNSSLALADDFIGSQKVAHRFAGSEVVLTTTQSFTSYNYGSPTVRFHESLDQVAFGKEDSMKLAQAMKSFYKTKTVGNTLVATLDTNFFGFVDDMTEIKCVNEEVCTITYNQDLKNQFLILDQIGPKYHAGINGTFINAFDTNSVEEAKNYVKDLQSRGSLSNVVAFQELSGENTFKLNLESGALAGLLKDANLCTNFIVQRCGTYCGGSGSANSNRDTQIVGVCQIELEN